MEESRVFRKVCTVRVESLVLSPKGFERSTVFGRSNSSLPLRPSVWVR